MGGRWALYSSYSSCLNVGPDRSKEMAQWVGFRSDRFRRKVLRKPYTPRTSSPVELTVMGVWIAKKALYTIACPSSSISSGFLADTAIYTVS